MGHKDLIGGKKSRNLKSELREREKLEHHFEIKFHIKSNGDSLDALKQCLDPEMGHNGLIGAKNRKIKI